MRITVSFLLLAILVLASQSFGQCRIINNKFNSVYITYERVGNVSLQGEAAEPGVILRLHNNSNCAVIISIEQSGDFKFRSKTVLSDMLFSYRIGESWQEITTGDAFLTISVRGGRSVLFDVPLDRFDEPNGLIKVPFRYEWEDKAERDGSRITVEHNIYFATSEIPKHVISNYNANQVQKYLQSGLCRHEPQHPGG